MSFIVDGYLHSGLNPDQTVMRLGSPVLQNSQNTEVLWCQRLNANPFSYSPFMNLAV